MIGQRIESRPAFPFAALFWLAIALVFAGLALCFFNAHCIVFAVMPVAIAAGLFFTREPRFAVRITDDGLEFEDPPLVVPYASMEEVLIAGKPGRAKAPIRILHEGGVARIPARLNVRSDDLSRFLVSQVPGAQGSDLPPVLQKYWGVQKALHGPERVFAYRPRSLRAFERRKKDIVGCLACALVGCVWVVAGVLLGHDGLTWIILGVVVAIVSLLGTLGLSLERGLPRIRNWRQSGLVIGPGGLALVQGDMRGELRWDELRDIRYPGKAPFIVVSSAYVQPRGIQLVVAGATITIADLYNQPLSHIHKRLKAYWEDYGEDE